MYTKSLQSCTDSVRWLIAPVATPLVTRGVPVSSRSSCASAAPTQSTFPALVQFPRRTETPRLAGSPADPSWPHSWDEDRFVTASVAMERMGWREATE